MKSKALSSVSELLELTSEIHPKNTAIVFQEKYYSYAAVNSEANKVCHWLFKNGVKTGDRVLLLGNNSAKLVSAMFGILKAGAVFVPLNPEISTGKLDFIIRDCTPSAIISDNISLAKLDFSIKRNLPPVLLTDNNMLEEYLKATTYWADLENYPDWKLEIPSSEIASILYTSGTTKDPRGVIEPHRQIIYVSSSINAVIGNNSEDKILCGLPLSFDYGLYQIFLSFQVGATLFLEKDFSILGSIPRILKINAVTGFPAVPSIFAMLLKSKLLERVELPDLRYITSTGDTFPVPHIRRLKELLPHVKIFPMYGLTECKRVSIMTPDQFESHEASVGLPIPGTKAFIVDENGNKVAPGIVGELYVQGPNVMAGYWNAPEETDLKFYTNSSTGEQILRSGDFFKMDDDGFLYFIGRSETLIKSNGFRISPFEIESFLCGLNGISEAVAVGIPDEILGESICVFISSNNQDLTVSKILAICRNEFSWINCPQHIILLDSILPKTSNGKLDRKLLREIAINKILREEEQVD